MFAAWCCPPLGAHSTPSDLSSVLVHGPNKGISAFVRRGTTNEELDEMKEIFEHEVQGLKDDVRQRVLTLIRAAKSNGNNIKEQALSWYDIMQRLANRPLAG